MEKMCSKYMLKMVWGVEGGLAPGKDEQAKTSCLYK
jgi:hypothetical protein